MESNLIVQVILKMLVILHPNETGHDYVDFHDPETTGSPSGFVI